MGWDDDLSNNPFFPFPSGATELAEDLPAMPALQELRLAHNLLGDRGTVALASSLPLLSHLR